MRVEYIDPTQVVLNRAIPVDLGYRDAIQEGGFDDENPGVRKRADGQYDVVKGETQLRAILALIEEDAFCYDLQSGHPVRASELYRRLRMCVFD